jgi:hypothetical protein
MISPMELNDNELLQQFKDCTLSPSFLTHEVLLRITWILIQQNGLERAVVKNCKLKERYFKNPLKNDKYNNALTIAYAEILHHFMEKTIVRDFNTFLQEFPRLKFSFKELVKTHYGFNILKEHRKTEPLSRRPILFTF